MSKKERARLRKTLSRQIRRNPNLILNRSFVRKATLAEFQLPMSVRLSRADGQGGYEASDDALEIDWDDSAFTWPLEAADGMMAAPQTVAISGSFSVDAVFGGGDTTGYGEPGATETLLGREVSMQADPFTISEFASACPSGPQLAVTPNQQVSLTAATSRYGVMNFFSPEFRGTLALRMTFASSLASSCGATPQTTPAVDNTSAPPVPVRFDGKFLVSPAITPDGKLRFGKITIDDAVTAQPSTFAFVRACTELAPTCNPQTFPARVKLKKLTAEVLVGRVIS
jgi:hypothetical protein